MGKLSDIQLRAWVKAGNPITGKSDGGGLTFTLSRAGVAAWVLRYRHGGKQPEYSIGRYPDISLAEARVLAAELRRRVQQGEDIAASKQDEKAKAAAEKAKALIKANTTSALAAEWLARAISDSHRPKVARVLDRYALPEIGLLSPEQVQPAHVDHVLRQTVKAGAPTTANDLLRYLKRLFAFARKRRIVTHNPAEDFDTSDAGGKELARTRALSVGEIGKFIAAMKDCETLGRDNELAFRLLLLLGVRKGELVGAAWHEFDLGAALWHLPAERSKTGEAIMIPLPPLAVKWFRELETRAAGSPWVFPARRIGKRRLGHISPDTLNVALTRLEHGLPAFTVHDLRRTVRTQLSALGVSPHIAERVLNHKLRGVAGVYDRHDYLEERLQALQQWAVMLANIEAGRQVVPLFKERSA